ncbi:MAG: ribonuclease P protein component [Pseudomonadota bacterium]
MSQGFSRHQRLVAAAEYRNVFTTPDSKAGDASCLLLASRNTLKQHRLGLAVAKKHIPSAVQRNRFKRLARERFRRLERRNPALDIVVLSRPAAATCSGQDLGRALDRQFARILRRTATGFNAAGETRASQATQTIQP